MLFTNERYENDPGYRAFVDACATLALHTPFAAAALAEVTAEHEVIAMRSVKFLSFLIDASGEYAATDPAALPRLCRAMRDGNRQGIERALEEAFEPKLREMQLSKRTDVKPALMPFTFSRQQTTNQQGE